MKCKYCNEEMAEKGTFCPVCGKNNVLDPEEVIVTDEEILLAVDELAAEETDLCEDEFDEELDEEFEDEEEIEEKRSEVSPTLKRARFMSAMTGCIATLAVLGVILFAGISGNFSEDGKGWDVGKLFSWIIPRENNVQYKDSYTVSAKKAMKKRTDVVATVPGASLTNGELQIYYWNQVYDFLNNYSYYLSQMGLDYTSPLDAQTNYYGTGSWQQYFLESAIEMWHSNMSFVMLAKENNFELSAEYRQELEDLRANMETTAQKNGFASAEAMLQDSMGPGCTMEDYMNYMETYYLGYSYFAEMYNAIDPTMEEIDAYFEANKASMNGVTKESGYTVDIRHILIKITKVEDGVEGQADEEGATEELIDGYNQAAWDACLAKAEAILEQWKNGEMTEESFAELAKTHSADGNAAEGGIYTGVEKGYMVESFDAWCFDESRVVGDYGIVRTKYGYHIMYFISSEDIWITQSRAAILSEEAQKIVKAALDAYPMEINYKKIVLGEVDLA